MDNQGCVFRGIRCARDIGFRIEKNGWERIKAKGVMLSIVEVCGKAGIPMSLS